MMENPMVENAIFIAFSIALACTLLLPIVLIIVLRIAKKIHMKPFWLGAAAFFVSQILLRIPLLGFLNTQSWFQPLMSSLLLYIVFLSLTAALFEESARCGGAFLLKNDRTFRDVLSFGLGHGFCEVILLIGLTHINNVLLCLIANSGTPITDSAVLAAVEQLAAVDPSLIYWGLLERFSVVLLHIFVTVLVFRGVVTKQYHFCVLAGLAHALFNYIGVVLLRYVNVLASETAMLVMALAGAAYLWYFRKQLQLLFDSAAKPVPH